MATNYSVDEIIATCKNSDLPTIFVEGKDDIIIYRKIEFVFKDSIVSIFGTGGRDKLLEIFRRRGELCDKNIVFIADQDTWVMSEIPREYIDDRIIFTDGYSIENDAIRDIALDNLLSHKERANFEKDLEKFLIWYAFAVDKHIENEENPICTHPGTIFKHKMHEKINVSECRKEIIEKIKRDTKKFVRGKSLLDLYMIYLSRKGRVPPHKRESLLELSAVSRGELISRIFKDAISAIKDSEHS